MTEVIEILIYVTGSLSLMVILMYSCLWLIGKIYKLLGNYSILISAINKVARERKNL